MVMNKMNKLWIVKFSLLISAAKLFLIYAYRSTDFEVHRNWLAITYSLPLEDWYKDSTSVWTLDYPPLFAWFEKILSLAAWCFDPDMLIVSNLDHASWSTVVFQRLSVIVADLVLIFAIWQYVDQFTTRDTQHADGFNQPKLILLILLLTNAGLVLVDHIHFQYNGFLFGVLILSILRTCQGRYVEGCVWFATLLNLKHIYLYMAPAFGIFLLRNYCFRHETADRIVLKSFSMLRFCLLLTAGLSVFLLSFGPFIIKNQVGDVLSRLFPFKRGLCHSYWAPNFWALYNVVDKVLLVTGSRLGLIKNTDTVTGSMTGGLVQQYEHAVLPSVRPIHTLVLTVASLLPSLLYTWLYGSKRRHLIQCIVLCSFSAFMFGWHVHEKAILLMIIPLALLSVDNSANASLFLLLSTVGHFSLFPLIYTTAETLLKYALFLSYAIFSFYSLGKLYRDKGCSYRLPMLNVAETFYLIGLVFVEIYCQLIHSLLGLNTSLPFFPLLSTSVYCALGVSYVWCKAHLALFRPI